MFTLFKTFFFLGWISFGGPAAHIGYFRNTFVKKLHWLSEEEYGQLVALSQFLPGPGSSQVGFAIGYKKAGIVGAFTAFFAFTLPSVLIMLSLAALSSTVTETATFQAVVHGLKLLAVVVVFEAILGMYQNFCKERTTVLLATVTAITLLIYGGTAVQIGTLVFAASVGARKLTGEPQPVQRKATINMIPMLTFVLLISIGFASPLLMGGTKVFAEFFQAGSLVFGGGHVVLPLLQSIVGSQLSPDEFLTGYAAAQAIPGPMFTLATYLGYFLLPESPILGALTATIAVFLPGFLLILAVLQNWHTLAKQPKLAGAIKGVNAAVVGLLMSALYSPIFTEAVFNTVDMAVVILGIVLLKQFKMPIVWLVVLFAVLGCVV
ncbi:chromate efflux transporter [Thaumasiovibrio sp. DFM-14]|uniref:chromate efflux transporter n=1 Tax=Thaumasiovibrio sp. DFM-14 TaxID=3384792 RepID=UPI0039A1BBF8